MSTVIRTTDYASGVAVLAERWSAAWAQMQERRIGALLLRGHGVVGSYGPLLILTGYFPPLKGCYGILPLGERPFVLLPSEPEVEHARATVHGVRFEVAEGGDALSVARLIREGGFATVGVVSPGARGIPSVDDVTMRSLLPEVTFEDAAGVLVAVRRQSAWDVAGLSDAVRTCELGINAFADRVSPGMTEQEAAGVIALELGHHNVLMSLIYVSAGEYLGQLPTARSIRRDDVVTVLVETAAPSGHWAEVGAVFAAAGASPDARALAQQMCDIMREATTAVAGSSPSRLASILLGRVAIHGEYTGLGIGHGVGIDEAPPVVSVHATELFYPGQGLALHPSLRRRDLQLALSAATTVLVGENGAECLTDYPTRLWELSS